MYIGLSLRLLMKEVLEQKWGDSIRKWMAYLLTIVILLTGCSKTVNINNIAKQPNFKGVVTKIEDHSILVKVNENEEEMRSSNLMWASLDVELEESMTDFNIGDEVQIYYDGKIALSYPAQIHNVYAIVPAGALE